MVDGITSEMVKKGMKETIERNESVFKLVGLSGNVHGAVRCDGCLVTSAVC